MKIKNILPPPPHTSLFLLFRVGLAVVLIISFNLQIGMTQEECGVTSDMTSQYPLIQEECPDIPFEITQISPKIVNIYFHVVRKSDGTGDYYFPHIVI